jgi:hypothetical protein
MTRAQRLSWCCDVFLGRSAHPQHPFIARVPVAHAGSSYPTKTGFARTHRKDAKGKAANHALHFIHNTTHMLAL